MGEVIAGTWDVKLEHVDGTQRSITLDDLIDFNERKDLEFFAGTITYTKRFNIDTAEMPQWLTLGHVHAISGLTINDHALGVRWYGEHLYQLAGTVKRGSNNLSIKVVTTLGDYMKSLANNPTAVKWTSDTPRYSLGLTQPPRLLKEVNDQS
jgi:hypothetical protein